MPARSTPDDSAYVEPVVVETKEPERPEGAPPPVDYGPATHSEYGDDNPEPPTNEPEPESK